MHKPCGGASAIKIAILTLDSSQSILFKQSARPQHIASGKSPPPEAIVLFMNCFAMLTSSVS
jgi:hypothetical protein